MPAMSNAAWATTAPDPEFTPSARIETWPLTTGPRKIGKPPPLTSMASSALAEAPAPARLSMAIAERSMSPWTAISMPVSITVRASALAEPAPSFTALALSDSGPSRMLWASSVPERAVMSCRAEATAAPAP